MNGRLATTEDAQIASDRLRGNGAWNGQGLLIFLAATSRRDKERSWMEPLRDLCERVLYGLEDGLQVELSDDEVAIFDDLITYSQKFHAAISSK